MQQGMQKGEGLLLQKLLIRCLGLLPVCVVDQIAQATLEQLEIWGIRILDSISLEDVFRTH